MLLIIGEGMLLVVAVVVLLLVATYLSCVCFKWLPLNPLPPEAYVSDGKGIGRVD